MNNMELAMMYASLSIGFSYAARSVASHGRRGRQRRLTGTCKLLLVLSLVSLAACLWFSVAQLREKMGW